MKMELASPKVTWESYHPSNLGSRKSAFQRPFALTNLDPSISWGLPRWEICHQISQDLIDAVRKIFSRVPPSSGGKRLKNNAAQEPSHTCETTFRHETCLPATWPPLHPNQRLCQNVGTATTMCKEWFVSFPLLVGHQWTLTSKVLNNLYTHLHIYKSQQELFAQPPPDVRSGIILRSKQISFSPHLLPNWGLSHKINVFWIDFLLTPS